MARGQVAGDDDELVGEPAVGHRDAGDPGDGDRAGDAGDDLHRDVGGRAREELLHAAAEDERVPALEPDDEPARARVPDERRVDLLLRHGPPARQLRGVHDLDVGPEPGQQRPGAEVVDDHDVGLRQRLPAARR